MFFRLPPANDDEWLNLKGFVSQYNYENNASFDFFSSLDKLDSTQPQPEVLLLDGDSKMVIERKVFPWPSNYIRCHQLWLEFNRLIFSRLISHFSDNIYVLEISDSDVPRNKRETIDLANHIAESILTHQEFLITHNGMSEDKSPQWKFFRLDAFEYNNEYNEPGIVIRLKNSFDSYRPQDFEQHDAAITEQLMIPIERTVPKFKSYSDCLRILVIELYSNILSLDTDVLKRILSCMKIHEEIDQLWIAENIEIESNEQYIIYHRI